MAAYIDVLRRRFAGRQFTIWANDPRNLKAEDGGAVPTKEELDALMAEVDAEIDAEERLARQQERFLNANQDALLLAFDIIADALADTRSKLRPAALTGPLDDQVSNRLQVLRNRLNNARS